MENRLDNDALQDTPDPLVLEQYFAGDCSSDEAHEVESWVSGHHERKTFLDAMRLAWMQTGRTVDVPAYDVESEWNRLSVRSSMEQTDEYATPLRVVTRSSDTNVKSGRKLVGTAFGLAIAAGLAIVATMQFDKASPSSATPTVYATAKGQRATVTLADGTLAHLSVDSRLVVPADFGKENRKVNLTGQASFVVTHAQGKTFIVEANGTRTSVLGTRFGIRAYADMRGAVVAVKEGKVSAENAVLTANDVVRVFSGRRSEKLVNANADAELAFEDGKLNLEPQPLREAVTALSRWYDADIQFADPRVASQSISGRLASGTSRDLAQLLELSFGIRSKVSGRTLTLYMN